MDPHSPEEILAPLNEPQRMAAAHMDGPLLILAGPGSGKTRVVTHRMAHMIARGIPSEQMVALTFTNKAAEEMRNRLRTLAPGNRAWTSTFHRFCSRLLRQHASMVGLRENFTIYDSGDSKKVIKQAIENVDVNLKHYSADKLAHEIGQVKNHGVTVESFQPRPGHALDAIVARVYPEYQKLLQLANGVDFDDLLLYAVDLLRNAPELRQSLDEHFRYMMVDEYQDTNLAQYQLIRLLNHTHQNLAVTGDPDQSIYGWRGANIQNILQFERDYEQVTTVRLEQNYRSTQAIVRAADQLIRNNTRRKEKALRTENDEGESVRLVTYPSPNDESLDIADSIALAISQGRRRARDYAILYRANYLSRSLEHALRSGGVPYQIVNGHEFYQRREIKDLLGYLHLLNNPADNVALERVINVPARKIGKVTLGRLRRYALDRGIAMLEAAREVDQIDSISKAPAAKIRQFVDLMDRLTSVPPEHVEVVIQQVLAETDYRTWLTRDGSDEGFERAGNVDELLVAAREFDHEHADGGGLEAYLEQASLVADTDVWESDSDFVTLMTLHAAKGLEFPEVFIVGLEDGILPHERSAVDDEQVEEERRLFFVGITRAREQLQISRCQNRFRRGSYWPAIASRFLMELPRHEMQVFEPMTSGYESSEADDLVDDLSSWDEPWSIDVGEGNASESSTMHDAGDPPGEDRIREARQGLQDRLEKITGGASPTSASRVSRKGAAALPGKPAVPPAVGAMMTGAELEALAAAQSAGRLRPEQAVVGMWVAHDEYGAGQIVELTGHGVKRMAAIDFDGPGVRKFRVSHANLKIDADRV